MTWHRAVESLVSVSNCVICILPLLLSSKYNNIAVGIVLRQAIIVRPCAVTHIDGGSGLGATAVIQSRPVGWH